MPGLIENWKFDLPSGFIVFLIALPLCLGIALASGAPPIAGIITGIIGGIWGSLTSGSQLTINGPAAGLIVIVLGAVTAFGGGDPVVGFKCALAVGVVCGAIQILLGFLSAGKLTNMFPLSVVHGMLAGIGIIIVAKQIHVALGITVTGHMISTIAAIPDSLINRHPVVTVIAVISIAIMTFWPTLKTIARFIPAPMLVMIITIPVAHYYQLDAAYLVQIPHDFSSAFMFPDWSWIGTGIFWKFVMTYVVVASIESLLTAAAIDKKDRWKRRSNMNRELMGKGSANMLSSLIGGLPMIAEVVRSWANTMNGARTRWANFFHGSFLLLFVVLLPNVLNMIPLAALAGILVFIGCRLINPKECIHLFRISNAEFYFMLITTVLVVAIDLFWGLMMGFVIAALGSLIRGMPIKKLFHATVNITQEKETVHIVFKTPLGFTNYLSIQDQLNNLPSGKKLVFDYREAGFIDYTAQEHLRDFAEIYIIRGGSIHEKK
jgi:MFS superfamily sulfate permease-like transporter